MKTEHAEFRKPVLAIHASTALVCLAACGLGAGEVQVPAKSDGPPTAQMQAIDAGDRRGDGPPMGEQGNPIPETQAHTAGILCGISRDQPNPTLGINSNSQWVCEAGQRVLSANGVPDHAIGKFPNSANPNKVTQQSISFAASLRPIARSGAGVHVKDSGYALNGVKFDPGTNGRCASGAQSPAACDLGRGVGDWRIEALGQTAFDFGVDPNNAHVQPNGAYHYHGIPEGLLGASAKAGKAMALIGWAADGFPIYARFGHTDPRSADSPLRVMKSSYRLKPKPDRGRPPIEIIPMGAFTQDYEFVEGSGDLDECNGRTDVTPEFPAGIYHYYGTDSYPFLQRCVKGTPNRSSMRPPPPGGPPPP